LKARVDQASGEIMAVCIAAGGTITGEHGIGLDKLRYMPLLFDGDALAAMRAVRRVFDPDERVNPGKVVPVHACREWSGLRIADRGLRIEGRGRSLAQSAIDNPQSAVAPRGARRAASTPSEPRPGKTPWTPPRRAAACRRPL